MDFKSLVMANVTGVGFISYTVTKANILFWVTVLAAASTAIYNGWKMYQDIKNKNH